MRLFFTSLKPPAKNHCYGSVDVTEKTISRYPKKDLVGQNSADSFSFQLPDQPGNRSGPTKADNGDGQRWLDVSFEHLHRQRRTSTCGRRLIWSGIHSDASR